MIDQDLYVKRIRAYQATHGCTLVQAKRAVEANEDLGVNEDLDAAPAGDAGRVKQLEEVIRNLLRDVVPHVRETGHNAADREIRAAVSAARAAVTT
ncbi:hypothetical protein [Duganella vulcania]|uniref:Uncharacterized protein n=1 Tax=Duganella vulcania TaxID=2692166 RepID=A0A845GGI1_9BURK|nr:hypothetical protein [Duganella vulcania]MYM92495.1 hypothetical protein [Duganella vulcania]